MTKEMPSTNKTQGNESTKNTMVTLLVMFAAILFLIGAMVYSIYHPFPSGKSLTLSSFIGLWLRELVILSFLAIVTIGILIKKIRTYLINKGQAKNAS